MINEKISKLRKEITRHDKFYDEGRPEITDSEYDKLYLELVELEKRHPELDDPTSPTRRIVVSDVERVSNLEKIRHTTPMLSLEKATSFDEVESFLSRVKSPVLLQEKLDGLSIILRYEDYELKQAITRGNGLIGEDVTHILRKFKNIPKTIEEESLEVRGEIIMPYEDFERANLDGKYSNPRNYASGQLRRVDNEGIEDLGLQVIAYDITSDPGEMTDDIDRLRFLKSLGFDVVKHKEFDYKNLEGLQEEIIKYEDVLREQLPYMIDGLVIKVSSSSIRDKFGSTSKHPKWAIAYKFKSLDAITTLLDVSWSVGKQGQITPVAILDIVEIDNVNIGRATLHNVGNIKDKDIKINDRVIVKRANDVIPFIVGPVLELRKGLESKVVIPESCPSCGEKTEFKGEHLFCLNRNCEPQLKARLVHYASREAMNIDGLAEKTVEIFYEEGIIRSISDIYNLKNKRKEVLSLKGYGEKKFDRIVDSVEKSKKNDFNQFLYGLSINNIGRSASRALAKEFKDMSSILDSLKDKGALKEQILTIPDFGDIMADNFINFLLVDKNIELIRTLRDNGVNMTEEIEEEVIVDANSEIFDMRFAITGKLELVKNRGELQKMIEAKGGKIAKSISKNVDYLVNNDIHSNSSKNKAAKELNIPIITEDEVLKMIS